MNTNSPNRVPSRRGPAHRAPIAMRPIFDGVSAYVDVTLTGNVDASAPFRAKLIAKGAKVTANICPTTTHVHLSRRGRRARRRAAPQAGRDEVQGRSSRGRVPALGHEQRAPRGDGGREGLRDDAARRPVQVFDDAEAQRHAEERVSKRNEKARSTVLGIGGFDEVRLGRATNGGDRGGGWTRNEGAATPRRRRRRRSRRRCERRRRRKDARSSSVRPRSVNVMKTSRRRRI